MELTLTAPRSELGGVLSAALARAPTRGGGPRVVIDISLQPPNNLLHDGRRWATFSPSRLSTLARATQRRHADADFLVHASYLFLNAVEAGARPGDTLRPIVDGALAAERIVMDGAVPACVVRLGYVYGPESQDLRAYRRAFRIGRPYWAGPPQTTQRHLHSDDAVRALLAAARPTTSPHRSPPSWTNSPGSWAIHSHSIYRQRPDRSRTSSSPRSTCRWSSWSPARVRSGRARGASRRSSPTIAAVCARWSTHGHLVERRQFETG